MIDQSFNISNFENIYDFESRKQNIKNLLGELYVDKLNEIKKIKDELQVITSKKRSLRSLDEESAITQKSEQILQLKYEKREIQYKVLQKISDVINRKDYKFQLIKKDKIYTVEKTEYSFFAIKQLQRNIQKTFHIKPANRHLILSQLKLILNDGTPKYIIRLDIKHFFESIDQNRLIAKIEISTDLSQKSKKLINQVLDEFNNKQPSNNSTRQGIPRGVGISAYLSELYMKDIDAKIKNINDVVFYARYVDDIFIVISPTTHLCLSNYIEKIKPFFEKEMLEIHTDGEKYKEIDLTKNELMNNKNIELTYLGYKMYIHQSCKKTEHRKKTDIEVVFGLSDNKKNKIITHITQAIEYFNNYSKYDLNMARKSLLLCIKFLTTNIKLNSSKRRVRVGIFYSNDLIDDCRITDILYFDTQLKTICKEKLKPYEKLFDKQTQKNYTEKIIATIIKRYSFYDGYINKRYHSFTKKDFELIKRIMK